MADLFSNEKALALVEGIVRVGYLTHEVPIVLRRNRRLIVVEGNRRVAALKAIQNPYLVPDFQARVSALAGELPDRDRLRQIEVKRAPRQIEADQLIAALHTGNTRVRWTPARQAAFFQAQVDAGKTLKQLREQYPTIGVEKFVLRSGILNLFKSIPYANPEHSDLLSSRGSSTSTLARIYESRPFIELTGLHMNEAGDICLSVSKDTFAKMADNIVSGIADGDINTRSVNSTNSPRYQLLIEELRSIAEAALPDPASSDSAGRHDQSHSDVSKTGQSGTDGKVSSPTSVSESQRTSPAASGPASSGGVTGPPPRASRPYLDIGQLTVPLGYPEAVKLSLQELSAINIQRFPNATFDLMRTFLEKSIKAYAESLNEDMRRNGNNGYVYLRNCLEWLEARVTANGPRYLVQVLKQLQSNKVSDFTTSSDYLNAINHNHHVFVTTEEVRKSWAQMVSVLTEVLK